MRPSQIESSGSQRTERDRSNSSPSTSTVASTRGIRSEGNTSPLPIIKQDPVSLITLTDSWIEIPSRPSSSSLSSTTNDIVTTGLSIRPQEERLSRHLRASGLNNDERQPRATSTTGSSQDEYEESESESERVMSSSNEDIYQDGAGGDDDDTSTALGVGSMNRVFTPQPNAFSHPPSSQPRPIPDSYFPAVPSTTGADRTITQRSYQNQTRTRNNHPAMSSYQPDHDAALRASLTTLLSCAAAVRPKGQPSTSRTAPTRASTQPTTLRLVAESELGSTSAQSNNRRPSSSPQKQQKRKSRESSKERQVKKARAAKAAALMGEDLISPTLASWMISAGVVLVFSAISFSAGYAWGREVGRIEGEFGLGGAAGANAGCGQEAIRGSGTGLRRLRWSSGTSSVRA
ncbi:hypothetical protein LTR84_011145 [Exophiala bonariae]|uniref:Uncharacterized protein n=1 Tax=Exophiala bonariae TaxID=1690606 RepID=A0AAV9NIQ1_9EURO|nr:hypothetical protein LTR84_011145 [Exophiala bonariae]